MTDLLTKTILMLRLEKEDKHADVAALRAEIDKGSWDTDIRESCLTLASYLLLKQGIETDIAAFREVIEKEEKSASGWRRTVGKCIDSSAKRRAEAEIESARGRIADLDRFIKTYTRYVKQWEESMQNKTELTAWEAGGYAAERPPGMVRKEEKRLAAMAADKGTIRLPLSWPRKYLSP